MISRLLKPRSSRCCSRLLRLLRRPTSAAIARARHARDPGLKMSGCRHGATSRDPIPGATSSCTRPKVRPARRYGALEQHKNPTRRGVTVWVETDGTVYWAVTEISSRPMATAATATTTSTSTTARPTARWSAATRSASSSPAIILMSRRTDRGADRRMARAGDALLRALRHPARSGLCAQLDRLQGRPLLQQLRAGDHGAEVEQ